MKTLKEFAKLAGVVLVDRVDEEKWGGRFGYTLKDEEGRYSVLGMKTEEQVYESWAERTFGEKAKAALCSLLNSFQLEPIETAPKDGTYILLFGPSGYNTTPLRCEVCRYDAEYRPLQPWITYSDDSFLDSGPPPTHWMPLPSVTT